MCFPGAREVQPIVAPGRPGREARSPSGTLIFETTGGVVRGPIEERGYATHQFHHGVEVGRPFPDSDFLCVVVDVPLEQRQRAEDLVDRAPSACALRSPGTIER